MYNPKAYEVYNKHTEEVLSTTFTRGEAKNFIRGYYNKAKAADLKIAHALRIRTIRTGM